MEKTSRIVEKEHEKRKRSFLKRKRRILVAYPVIAVLSAVLAFVGLQSTSLLGALPFLISLFLLHVAFAAHYVRFKRAFLSIGRYPSPAFDQIQLSVLALTQAVYKFVVTGNILTPVEIPLSHVPTKNKV